MNLSVVLPERFNRAGKGIISLHTLYNFHHPSM
jgi:hypothetical protein